MLCRPCFRTRAAKHQANEDWPANPNPLPEDPDWATRAVSEERNVLDENWRPPAGDKRWGRCTVCAIWQSRPTKKGEKKCTATRGCEGLVEHVAVTPPE